MYIYIYICHKKEKPLKITHIFWNNIYFSRPYIFKMLDLHLQTKKSWEILNEHLKKNTKFRPPYLPNWNFTLHLFFSYKNQTICFSCLVDKWQTIPVSRFITFIVWSNDSFIYELPNFKSFAHLFISKYLLFSHSTKNNLYIYIYIYIYIPWINYTINFFIKVHFLQR